LSHRDLKIENLLLDEQDNIKLIGNAVASVIEYANNCFLAGFEQSIFKTVPSVACVVVFVGWAAVGVNPLRLR
jgi:serine/threonine protein kinase